MWKEKVVYKWWLSTFVTAGVLFEGDRYLPKVYRED